MAQQAEGRTFRYRNYRLFRDATLGTGAYGQVCRAQLDELPCAAKLLHPILVDRFDPKKQTNLRKFEQECRFLSEIRHPNIVQYLGMVYDSQSGLPVLLMELMDESLTHFLEQSTTRLPYHVQVDINHDIALALAYLHSNDIIHRDLSSNNVLLIGPGYQAKVTDFGMSKFTEMHPHMTPLTKCPGTAAYMAPEALQEEPVYSAQLDIFQAGVLMVQIITRKFPDPTRATRRITDPRSPTGVMLMPVPEMERRRNHLSLIAGAHPMLGLVRDCLKDKDTDRPTTQHLCQRLSALKEAVQYSESQQNEGGERGVGATGMREGEREGEVEGRERALEGREREVERRETELGEELRQERSEKERLSRRLDMTNVQVHQLQERCRQVENQLRDEIQQIQEEKDRAIAEKELVVAEKVQERLQLVAEREQLVVEKDREREQLLAEKDRIIHQLQSQSRAVSYSCSVSGPGLQSATVNYSTHVTVGLRDASGQSCVIPQEITSQLVGTEKQSWFKKKPQLHIDMMSPSQYKISLTAVTRGQHKLHIQHNDQEINGSPFTMTVYPDPTQLGKPVRVVTGLRNPRGIAKNSRGEVIVSEWSRHRIAVVDSSGKVVRTFGSKGDRTEQMIDPTGIAVDRDDNVYVTSSHKLQKFSRDGCLIKSVGQEGNVEGEFCAPTGLRLHNECVYVCDQLNHRIQIFDLELNFIRTFGSRGSGRGEFNSPFDLDFDVEGNMYIADFGNNRIKVLDTRNQFVRQFGHEGEGRLKLPSAVHVIGQFVYVSESGHHRISVFETSGQFVTSFGKYGKGEEEFFSPRCITSDHTGFIYICDWQNYRVKIL